MTQSNLLYKYDAHLTSYFICSTQSLINQTKVNSSREYLFNKGSKMVAIKTLNSMLVLLVLLFAVMATSNINMAEAGPVAYAVCVAACAANPICIGLCTPWLAAPGL